jgi:hypothetical protein
MSKVTYGRLDRVLRSIGFAGSFSWAAVTSSMPVIWIHPSLMNPTAAGHESCIGRQERRPKDAGALAQWLATALGGGGAPGTV